MKGNIYRKRVLSAGYRAKINPYGWSTAYGENMQGLK